MVTPQNAPINTYRSTAFNSSSDELKSSLIYFHLQLTYEAVNLLLYHPYLQYVLTTYPTAANTTMACIPADIGARAQKAVRISMRLISIAGSRQILDWFTLKQVIVAALLIIATSRVLGEDFLSPGEVVEAMNSATEILARTANRSESAKRALQLLCEIRFGLDSAAKERLN